MRNRFYGGVLVLSLIAVAAAGAQELDGLFDALELDGDLTWNGEVLDEPNSGDASNRTFLRGDGSWASVGLQDAAHAILTADSSTMSSTYATVLSASVTVGAASDAVRVDVTALLGWMGPAVYVVDSREPPSLVTELWQIERPENPALATNQGSFPSGLNAPAGITSHGGAVYVVDDTGDELWRCADPTSPSACVTQGSFPSGLGTPGGITSHAGAVYVVDDGSPDELWRCADPTSPSACVTQGSFPSGLTAPRGITSHGGAVYVVDSGGVDEMWRCLDPTSPGSCTLQGTFPSGLTAPQGITSHSGAVYVVDGTAAGMWRCADPTSPDECINQGSFPALLENPRGITSLGSGPCDIRLARGTTGVETITLTEGRILLDASFTDAPGVGTHTYAIQMKTANPNTLCTVYRGQGETPLPALFVQAFYGGA